ncbi:hypothetical protein [Salinisphaera orenii]|uniref:hypothetical protein n=1 Tax=Salinisphaera orenii TaxID=856731 RepID=UPI000DBE8934
MREIKDKRATGMPDTPYSAYCRVCWYSIYAVWFSSQDHGGVCPHGHQTASDCPDACGRAKFSVAIQKLRDQGLIKPAPET